MTKKISPENILLFVLTLASFGLLYPGVFFPVLTIKGNLSVPIIGNLDLGTQTRSIWGTVQFLYESKNNLVATLILLFSVILPLAKGILLLGILSPGLSQWNSYKTIAITWLQRIGKWSMADVFVIAIFLAYLATGSMKVFKAHLEQGFYYFLAYCITSMILTSWVGIWYKKQ